jgi:myo-inositol-1(or 4)-monophosphatase
VTLQSGDDGFFELLEVAKKTATNAALMLEQLRQDRCLGYEFDPVLEREMKAKADRIIESAVLEDLSTTGVPILSEESFDAFSDSVSGKRFIVDPIDGTVNYIRGIGFAAVSIALFDDDQPLFGVLAIDPGAELVWGGPSIGSFYAGNSIKVSNQTEKKKSILCTGIPARLDLSDTDQKEKFFSNITEFAKVRMLGAASISLFNVAKGSADSYVEQDVMIWDIAAGLAILLGAGGEYHLSRGSHKYSWDICGHNGKIIPKTTSF